MQELQSKLSGKEVPRSEADSEEAIQDVVAVSQEGSLGSLSDSDAGFGLPRSRQVCLSANGTTCCLKPICNLQLQDLFKHPVFV
jgi:hypothetical protein